MNFILIFIWSFLFLINREKYGLDQGYPFLWSTPQLPIMVSAPSSLLWAFIKHTICSNYHPLVIGNIITPDYCFMMLLNHSLNLGMNRFIQESFVRVARNEIWQLWENELKHLWLISLMINSCLIDCRS